MAAVEIEVRIPAGAAQLLGTLALGAEDSALVIFAHGSGSSRNSPRNREAATEWAIARQALPEGLAVGYFGASTGAAAALIAASRVQERIGAVVSRGGRPDLAGPALAHVVSPTLLIVGELDREVHVLNEQALSRLECEKDIAIVPGATHLFEEAGALEQVSSIAAAWFRRHLLGEDEPCRRARREASASPGSTGVASAPGGPWPPARTDRRRPRRRAAPPRCRGRAPGRPAAHRPSRAR